MIYQIDNHNDINDAQLAQRLEDGMVVHLPNLKFELTKEESDFIRTTAIPESAKNVSYNHVTGIIKGADLEIQRNLRPMLSRYQNFATDLINTLFPQYTNNIEVAKTSYRPIEIQGRKTSPRKDDTRLHVDAFPSNPNGGKRILRVFNNVNFEGKARSWRLGEPFPAVIEKFAKPAPFYFPALAHLLYKLNITKSLRTTYDQNMLHIHNSMKYDLGYQQEAPQLACEFFPGATWIVYTDIVSHAAMAGCHALEQTFNLPVAGMVSPEKSPKLILERFLRAS